MALNKLLKNWKQIRQLKALKIKYRTDVVYIYEKLEKFFSAVIYWKQLDIHDKGFI